MRKVPHHRRLPHHIYQQLQQNTNQSYPSTSPPTPTPMNIDKLAHFLYENTFSPIPTTTISHKRSKY